jgi:ankyrin repeat protein
MRIATAVLALSLLSSPTISSSAELNQQLYEAVNSFDAAAVGSLIEEGADPNSIYITGYTPLMRAVEIRQLEIVRQLLKSGADPNLRDRNARSTAEIAIEADSAEIVEALLKGGADFNVRDAYGSSMVLRTVESGSESMYEIVAAFGRHGVNMNVGTASQTPLYYAVEQNDIRMVQLLLEAGADPSLATESGGLPLVSALSNPETLDLLLKAGADPNGVDRDSNPVLFRAFSVSTEAAEALIEAGADVNRPDADGRTPLTRARDGGAEAITKLLERHGATDGKQEETQDEPAKQASMSDESAPSHEEYPRMADLPVYPGAETMFIQDEETHSANFISPDALSKVTKVTEELLEEAGWQDAKHPHAKTEKDRYYVMFGRGKFLLITDIGIARAMGNKTAITYGIVPKNSSFGRMN